MFRKPLGIPVCNSYKDLVIPKKNIDTQKKKKKEKMEIKRHKVSRKR